MSRESLLRGESLPPSALERILGFCDVVFRYYLACGDGSEDQLRTFYIEMASSEHPLVRTAAGWAAADFAVHHEEPDFKKVSLAERLECLQAAHGLWEGAAAGMQCLQEAQGSLKHRLQVRDIDMRRRQAIAYIPLMEVAASWLAHEPMSEEEVGLRRQQARQQSLAFREQVMHLPKGEGILPRNAGLVAETAVGLLTQFDNPLRHVVVPASLRQDSGPAGASSGDFVGISAQPPHRRVLIPVNASRRAAAKARPINTLEQVHFIAERDLVLTYGGHPRQTLEVIGSVEAGDAPVEIAATISVLARVMMLRLDAFHAQFEQQHLT